MYSFIKYTLGGNAARRAIYRVYDDKTKITSALCQDTGMNIDTFLEAWSYWMTTSGGTDDNVKSLIDSYTDNVNQYDYSHIYTTAASGQTDGGNSGSFVSRDNSITFNGKLNLAFDCTINSSDLFIKHLAVNKSGSDFIFTLDYESSAARMFSFFVPMSDSAIYLNYDSMKPGSNIIQFKIPISKLSNIDRIEMLFSIPRKAEKSSWLYFDTAPLNYLCPNKSDKKYDIDVMLNGAVLRFDQPPTIIGGKTLVPFRKIFESLGATVGWDKATKTASGAKGNINVSLVLGSTTAYVNGKPVVLEVPATSVNGSTMVPARFVAETLGAYVDWDKDTKTVIIVD
jgi:hypothetical protein